MPTYAYRCADCGHQFEQNQRFSDPPLTDCPACDGAVRRVIQPVGVVFKGSGWYITDSRKPAPDAKADKDADSKPDTKVDAKTDAASSTPDTVKKDAPAKSTSAEPVKVGAAASSKPAAD